MNEITKKYLAEHKRIQEQYDMERQRLELERDAEIKSAHRKVTILCWGVLFPLFSFISYVLLTWIKSLSTN